MSSYKEYAEQILLGGEFENKLFDTPFNWSEWEPFELPKSPNRSQRLKFSDLQLKFPKVSRLNETDKKALALHSFANHELLAIEMMAAALLIYPHQSDDDLRFKKGILSALKDEQKHLSLYVKRIQQLGYDLGDFPLNDFFWRQMEKLKTPEQYVSVMALTFEAANLDFAQHYAELFHSFGDHETASILETVLEDEISHVAFGAHWLKKWRKDKNLWDYYLSVLPWPLTPARSKGIHYKSHLHLKAVSDPDFVEKLSTYDDNFQITKRNSL